MKYAIASAVNLVTLTLGITIGLLIAPRVERGVLAGESPAQTTASPVQVEIGRTIDVNGQKVTGIQPAISAGNAAFYILLSHQVQADEMVVNGFNLMTLQQGELNLLQRFVPPADIANLIAQSRAKDLLTVGTPPQPKATPIAPQK